MRFAPRDLAGRALAVVILLVAAYLVFKLLVGVVAAVTSFLLILLALVGVAWALRTLSR